MVIEIIKFRLFRMPCCKTQICWVNPRLPNFCPECGKGVFVELRIKDDLALYRDDEAQLRYHPR